MTETPKTYLETLQFQYQQRVASMELIETQLADAAIPKTTEAILQRVDHLSRSYPVAFWEAHTLGLRPELIDVFRGQHRAYELGISALESQPTDELREHGIEIYTNNLQILDRILDSFQPREQRQM